MLEDEEVLVGNEKELCNVARFFIRCQRHNASETSSLGQGCISLSFLQPLPVLSTRGLAFLTKGLLISRREVGGEVKLGGELTVRDGDMGPMEL